MQKRQTLVKRFALLKNDITGSEPAFGIANILQKAQVLSQRFRFEVITNPKPSNHINNISFFFKKGIFIIFFNVKL
jgi:hypothetical protein